jgi:hypothetical protein
MTFSSAASKMLSAGSASPALGVLHNAEQDLGGFEVALRRAVDELLDNGLALADLAAPAAFADDNRFVERFVEQGR